YRLRAPGRGDPGPRRVPRRRCPRARRQLPRHLPRDPHRPVPGGVSRQGGPSRTRHGESGPAMDPTWDSMGMRPDPPWSALRRPPPATWADLVRRLGKTPLVSIPAEIGDRQWTVRLKLEGANPFGSIKDRTAYGLIRSLELEYARASRLAVVESTSGNLGIALAWMCALRGHSFIAVVDPLVAPDNLAL